MRRSHCPSRSPNVFFPNLKAKDSADILLAREGNLLQNLLVEESALAASAQFKDTIRKTFVDNPRRLRQTLPFGSFLPPLPFEEQLEPFVRKTDNEVKAQLLADKLLSLVPTDDGGSANNNGDIQPTVGSDSDTTAAVVLNVMRELEPEQAALVVKELRQNLPRYAPLVRS